MLIDAGANADARPEHLLQFAHMGVVFAQEILDVADPSVRLLSIGEEPEKGNQLTLEAHALLAAGRAPVRGQHRGARAARGRRRRRRLRRLHGQRRAEDARGHDPERAPARSATRSAPRPRARLGGLLIRPAARGLRARLDPDTYGGGYLLGLRGLVVIAHGSSSRVAIANATRMAARGVEHGLVERLADAAASAAEPATLARLADPCDASRPEAGLPAGRPAVDPCTTLKEGARGEPCGSPSSRLLESCAQSTRTDQ